MNLIRAKTAYYPSFQLGCEPQAIECQLSIVEANGKRYLKTPFAMLDSFSNVDIERFIDGRGYYATAAECEAYLAYEYPWWKQAAPIMDKLCSNRHHYGDIVGPGRLADQLGVSVDSLYQLARGHKRIGLKTVRAALRLLVPVAV